MDHDEADGAVRYTLIVLLSLTMGLQNAVARRRGIQGLRTTVFTRTLAGLAADLRPGRRILSVLVMFLGALFGAVLLRVEPSLVLGVALVLLAAGAVVLWRLSAPGAGWVTAP